jgi:sulfur dioxygenase
VFTGDALLIRAVGRTDLQGGNASLLYESITERLFSLPDATLVYPAHDYSGRTVSTIAEEKRWNQRIAGKSRAEFVAIMGALTLPEPKHLAETIPSNRACGGAPLP